VVVVVLVAVDLEFKLRRNAQRLHTIPRIICTIKVLKPERYYQFTDDVRFRISRYNFSN